MFGRCEYCDKTIAVQINFEAREGTVALCQCPEAFEAHVQAHRLKFQRKTAQRVLRSEKTVIKPRKVSRHRS